MMDIYSEKDPRTCVLTIHVSDNVHNRTTSGMYDGY